MSFKFYNLILLILFPVILIFFFFRFLNGKEDKKRILEKFSISSNSPISKKKVIWFHACSVGEVRSIYALIKSFSQNNYSVLVTTNTYLSSIDIRNNFPKNIIHQYLPIDYNFFTKRFLKKWNPKIAVIVESEIWPNLINNTKKKNIPICLIQARISDSSLKKWQYFQSFYKNILQQFNFIIAQSNLDKKKIKISSGLPVSGVINLKNSSPKIFCDKEIKKIFENKIYDKFVISAVSTHEGEEKIILNSYSKLLKMKKNIILVIQPRHPERKKSILKEIRKYNLNYKQRSLKEFPNKSTNVYLFDSFGESGLVIAIADLIILGGTLVPIGGHNLIEPAQFQKCIICGPYYFKISELVDYFNNNNAIILMKKKSLDQVIYNILKDRKKLKKKGINAKKITSNFKEETSIVYNKIKNLDN